MVRQRVNIIFFILSDLLTRLLLEPWMLPDGMEIFFDRSRVTYTQQNGCAWVAITAKIVVELASDLSCTFTLNDFVLSNSRSR
jgi:hypothetical protein